MNLEQLKYPVGKFVKPESITKDIIDSAISDIENFPNLVKAEIQNLDEKDLQLRYRPEGWTISQVVHHCADSHINSYMRFKLALTENVPTIKPYDESLWAELPDNNLTIGFFATSGSFARAMGLSFENVDRGRFE